MRAASVVLCSTDGGAGATVYRARTGLWLQSSPFTRVKHGIAAEAEAGTRGATIVSSRQGSLIRSLAKLYSLAKHHPELADFVLIS